MGSHDAHREGVVDTPCKTMILESFKKDSVSRVILVGEAGIGKTWMAREICEHANKVGDCYISLWLNLNKELDETLLYESIAYQLSVFLENEGSEDDDSSDDEDNSEDEKEQKKNDLTTLQLQIQMKLKKKKLRHEQKSYRNPHFIPKKEKSYLLLVLDDEGSVTREEQVMTSFHRETILSSNGPVKILLTRRKGEGGATDEMKPHATNELLDSHTIDASQVLCDTFTDDYLVVLLESLIKDDGLLESLEKAWGIDKGVLKHRIVEMSMRLPAAVVVLAKSLNCIASKLPFSLSPEQKEVFKTAVLSSFPSVSAFDYGDVEDPDRKRVTSRRNPILNLSYELLESDATMKSSILDCFWHSLSFFDHCGCVYYQELITHWILEGYFDPIISVKKAYKDGHAIVMELINRGILKIQEDNVVMPEVAMRNLIDFRRRGLSGRSRIGLAKVCGSDMTKGLGKINQMDDIIEAVRATRKQEKITTVLVSGNRFRRETPEQFFEKLKDLEILGLFKPTLDHFVPSLSKLVKLRVLVIRDCDLLDDIEGLKALQELQALEVSGASCLKKISDDFFKSLPKLQSLHLSGLRITSSPSSISELKKLHCLIIKECPLLKDLPDIQELVELEVVDISGAHGLQTCFDNTPGDKKDDSKNKNFYHLTKLQLLDFSESQIERLPIFQDSAEGKPLHSVTRLLLRNCSKLRRLPSLKPLSGLQILDLSGTTSLVKMLEVCFEDKKELRSLNLSGTNLSELPTTIEELSNLSELLLRDCTNLQVIPNIAKLTNLEVIDVSGCTRLDKIEGSFEDMFYLRIVNLSGTKVETPNLPKESKLCCPKHILLADSSCFEGENWSQITTHMKESASCSDAVKKYQEISEESRELGQNQSNDPDSTDFPSMRVVSLERFRHAPLDMALYQKSIPFVDFESHAKVLEINETNSIGGFADEDMENAEFVSFVNSSSTRLTSVFNKIKLVKGCWLRMCKDIEYLFSGVDEERLGSLEILSITNLRLLETISCGGSFQNLKKLSIDCCSNIKTLFLDASQLPSNLEVLHIKFCEKLEKVFGEECGNVSTLTTLCLHELPVLSEVAAKLPNLETFKKRNCPKLHATKEDLKGSEKVMVDRIEVSPQE